MSRTIYYSVIALLAFMLSACSGSDPGPLEGTWRMGGIMPMTIQFRSGETESMGMIEKVSYEIKGNDVLVTNKDGIAKGMTFRYTITSKDTAQTAFGALQRIK